MSEDKKIETSELNAPAMMSDSSGKLPGKDMGKDVIPSESISSGAVDQPLASEQGVHYPPTSFAYYYPGYNGTFAQSDDKGYFNMSGGSYTGTQPDNSSVLYYLPGYGPYATGSEYLQQPHSYGSEPFPSYAYDVTFARNGSTARSGSGRSMTGQSSSGKLHGLNTAKTNDNNRPSNTSAFPSNPNIQQPTSHFSTSIYQNQSLYPLNKSSGLVRGFPSGGKFSSFTNQNPQYGPVDYQSNDRVWSNNYRYKLRENFGRSGEIKAAAELTRGPRAVNRNNSSEVEQLGFAIEKDKYNSKEFQTEYDSAKFYVIKSYSEDDIHKSIKYDVWSSTTNGNRKLDAAFREADAKASEAGIKCPVFLYFSVNGSGQFVGVAEMIGPVDFSKNMDFWQLDKWDGFFPLKWHIIRDVPNMQLRHIILENNENRPVTHSRDTQEIGLKQGLEMLNIFKSYSEKTCVLDDFNFYENREKALKAKRNARPASQTNSYEKQNEAGERTNLEQSGKTNQSDPSSLISLTKNLSLNS